VRYRIALAIRGTLLGALVLLGTACSDSSRVTLEAVGTSPGATLSTASASVPVGVVLGFHVTSDAAMAVTATVDDTTIATVTPTIQTSEFLLVGLATGQTTLHVFVGDQPAIEVPVQVASAVP
jgi:hypothetical protein